MNIFSKILLISSIAFSQIFAQGYKLVWSDEFNDTTLDLSKWSYETGNNSGWGNSESEYYTSRASNCNVKNGLLNITAVKESYYGYNYTSARIKTQGKFSVKYGKIEARMKLPYGNGIWPAFWMLGDNISTAGWPQCGENDIMEMIGGTGTGNTGSKLSDATIYGTVHWYTNQHASAGGNYSLSSGKFADDFHVIGVVWTPKLIQFYVDGTTYYTIDISSSALSAFQNKFFIILNLAVGGQWPGYPNSSTVFPQSYQVDYVRVYQDTTLYPSVSVTSPTDNSYFDANSNITLSANAGYSGGTISKVEFYQDSVKIGEAFTSPYQMNWNNVAPGSYRISCTAYTNTGFSSKSDAVNITVGSGWTTSPYGGTPAKVPGTIEVENFDLGGQGLAYYDSDTQNSGGQYRLTDGVDIELCSDTGGGYDVGWTQSNEWMAYTISVSDSGSYQIGTRVATTATGGALHYEIDGADVTGTISVPNTGGWQAWTTVQSQSFNLSAGTHVVKVFINSGNFNINKFNIFPPNAQPYITITYPSGGEELISGNIVEIKWNSLLINQVMLGFSTNGGSSWSLLQNGVDAKFGVYRWKVPSVTSSKCRIVAMNKDNSSISDTTKIDFSIGLTGISDDKTNLPSGYALNQNYPNPFNPSTVITWQLASENFVTLKIYDMLGNEVATLINEEQSAGAHSAVFNSQQIAGRKGAFAAGVYYYRIHAGNFTDTKKLILLK
jgi:beta-glucanase (GH16 family)